MRKLLAIVGYDLRWAADPVALLFAFALPLIIALLIELAFGDLVLERGVPDAPVPVAIVNLDQGSRLGNFGAVLTGEIISGTHALAGPRPAAETAGRDEGSAWRGLLYRLFTARAMTSEAAARQMVERETLVGALIIPADFSATLVSRPLAGGAGPAGAGGTRLTVYTNDRYVFRGVALANLAEALAAALSAAEATASAAAHGLLADARLRSQLREGRLDAALADLARAAAAPEAMPIQIVVKPADSGLPRLALARQLAAAIAIFFAGFTGLLASAVLLQERAQWTLQRMAVTPTPPWVILAGKTAGIYLKGLIQIVVLLGCIAALEWLQRTPTSPIYRSANPPLALDPLGLGLLALALVAATTGFGAAIAAQARNYAQAINYGLGILALMGLIGGIFFPVNFFPPVLQAASRLTFHFWALDAYTRLALGAGAAAILPHLVALVSMGLLAFAFGVWSLRRPTPFL